MSKRKFIVDCGEIPSGLPNDGVKAFLEIFQDIAPMVGATLNYSPIVGLFVQKYNPETNTFYLKAILLKK